MSDTVLVAIIGVISSLLTSVVAVIPTIVSNRKKTQQSLMETDQQIKESLKDTNKRIDRLTSDFVLYKQEDEDRWAQETRVRFLNFNDSICDSHRPWPSKGSFEQAVKDCDDYEEYIETHEGFRNGIGELAMENIRKQYSNCQTHQLFGAEKE